MSKVDELIETSKKNNTGTRKNNEEYMNILIAVLTDPDYVAHDLSEIKDGEVIINDKHISSEFMKVVISAFKKTGMSEEEATSAAKTFKVNKEMAQGILDAVRETDYIVLTKCGKKLLLFKKPELEVNLKKKNVDLSIKKNPRDKDKRIIINKRIRISTEHILHPFQKEATTSKDPRVKEYEKKQDLKKKEEENKHKKNK